MNDMQVRGLSVRDHRLLGSGLSKSAARGQIWGNHQMAGYFGTAV